MSDAPNSRDPSGFRCRGTELVSLVRFARRAEGEPNAHTRSIERQTATATAAPARMTNLGRRDAAT